MEEVQKNIEACFESITDVLVAKKVVHQILMFDEIATEKRIRWDSKTNQFPGVCREHASKVSLELMARTTATTWRSIFVVFIPQHC